MIASKNEMLKSKVFDLEKATKILLLNLKA